MNQNLHLNGIAYGCPKNSTTDDGQLLETDHLSFEVKIKWVDEPCKE